jgi:eukaryotic-like serine/threonine-protein kinase
LGRGSMSEVYAGHKDNRVVTVKVLLPELTNNAVLYNHFKHEAEAMAGLTHPNIRTLYQQGEAEGLQYLILEHIEGYDLKAHLREHGPLSLEEALSMMTQLASALDYLHSQGIVHRDLKPENIMLQQESDGRYHVWLTDFGLAKLSSQVVSIYGEEAVGTINYMSPEQIQAKKTIDHRADIYAMGIVLYEMLTGSVPFTGSLAQILFAHLNQPAPDICDVLPEMSGDVSWAILSAMSKEAADRPNTAHEFVSMLSGDFATSPIEDLMEAV